MRTLVVVLAALAALASGCGGDDPEPVTGPGLPSQAALKSYFQAITGGDVDEMTRVQSEVTADGSLAQGYAAYDAEFTTAATSSGQPPDPVDVEEVDGGFKACIGDSADQCATWTDLKGQDGKLADFSINGRPLADLLVDLTAQAPVRSEGLYEVQPEWAYRQPTSGRLFVVCRVTAFDAAISTKLGTYIEGDTILEGVEAPTPGIIKAGASSPIALGFEGAGKVALDGQVTFDLKLGGGTTESIGFGLADPPAP